MTADALDRIGDRMTGGRVEAVVAVEQARAVAQVAAAVQVAQTYPRNLDRVRTEIAEACSHYELACRAFYSVENRGEGKSVHLARALAVIWGNLDYGVHELRRDDTAGMSEVQAFAWDQQRNSRHTRTFQVPHMTMKGKGRAATRVPITDLTDVYRNNQNVGARAVRECIFGVISRDVVDYAERLCRETLQRGDGKPIEQRRQDAVAVFARMGVTREQLEARVGRPLDRWDAEDVAGLVVVWQSIREGDTTVAEQFDPATARVTVDELGGDADTAGGPAEVPEPPADDPRPATQPQVGRIIGKLRDLDVESDEDQLAWLSRELRRDIDSRKRITRAEFDRLDAVLDVLIAERGDQPGADQ
jgi:hypothetical protein